MMPEVLLGVAPDGALERARVGGHDRIDIRFQIISAPHRHFLEAYRERARGVPHGGGENQRSPEAQCKNRRPARRLGIPSENRNPGGDEPDSVSGYAERKYV